MTDLEVRGGAGGVSARLEDLDLAGARLASLGATLGGHVPELVRVRGQVAGADGRVHALGAYLAAERALAAALGGVHGLVPTAAAVTALGHLLLTAAAGYRAADAAAAAGLRATRDGLGWAAGAGLAGGAPLWAPLLAGTALGVAAVGLVAPGVAGSLGAGAVRGAADHAGLTQLLLGTLPAVGTGALATLPPAVVAAITGSATGPRDAPGVAAALAHAAAVLGMLREGRPWLRDPARVRLSAGPRSTVCPAGGVGGLVRRVPDPGPAAGAVRVDRIDAADGTRRWVVAVPGTADWALTPRRTPFDLTSDVGLLAGRRTAGTTAVVAALEASGVRPGEPVLVTGHSQGGMVAAAVAAEPAVRQRFSITHVVTTGAPVATVPMPDRVHVLSVEHADDLVPSLDGARNPDRPDWVTVTADAPPTDDPEPLVAHRQGAYERTADAVDRSDDPSVRAWRRSAEPFLGRPGDRVTTQSWSAVRVSEP